MHTYKTKNKTQNQENTHLTGNTIQYTPHLQNLKRKNDRQKKTNYII